MMLRLGCHATLPHTLTPPSQVIMAGNNQVHQQKGKQCYHSACIPSQSPSVSGSATPCCPSWHAMYTSCSCEPLPMRNTRCYCTAVRADVPMPQSCQCSPLPWPRAQCQLEDKQAQEHKSLTTPVLTVCRRSTCPSHWQLWI